MTVYRVTSLRHALSHATKLNFMVHILMTSIYHKGLFRIVYTSCINHKRFGRHNFKMRILRFSQRCRCWFIPRKWKHQIASKRRNPHTQRCSVISEQIWIFCSGKHLELVEWKSEKMQMVTCHIKGHKFGRSGCRWHSTTWSGFICLTIDKWRTVVNTALSFWVTQSAGNSLINGGTMWFAGGTALYGVS